MSKLLGVTTTRQLDGSKTWHVTFDGQYHGPSMVIIHHQLDGFGRTATPSLVLNYPVLSKCDELFGKGNWTYRIGGDPDDRSPSAWRVHFNFDNEESVTMFLLSCANHSA